MRFEFDPTPGSIGGSVWAHPPYVNDPQLGRSRSVVPIINRIHVDDRPQLGARMGQIAKVIFFPEYPAFVFNVCFAVGDFSLILQPGLYGDPHSHWFNVFMGYYQLDAPKAIWTRPFGYERADTHARVAFEDILRLGKADWNYFSNYMYGVPEDCIEPYNKVDPSTPCRNLGRLPIGQRSWDSIEIEDEAVSAYESETPGARGLVYNSMLTPLWRRTFGLPCPRPDFQQSFISTKLRGRMYMSFSEDEDSYHTVIFGGTVNKSFPASLNERFLELQMQACRETIERHYPRLGFVEQIMPPQNHERIEAIGDQLRAKITSKFTASTFLAGFALTILSGQVFMLWQSSVLPLLLPLAVFAVAAAVVLFVDAIVRLDELTMPKRFWGESNGAEETGHSSREAYLLDNDLWDLQKHMIFYWTRLTLVATWMTGFAVLAMLVPFKPTSTERIHLLTFVLALLGAVVGKTYSVVVRAAAFNAKDDTRRLNKLMRRID